MTDSSQTFQQWLIAEVMAVLGRQSLPSPVLLWCDPNREWLDLLRTAAARGGFELWADPDEHELVLRDRFYRAPRAPRVVWLPRARDEITWFKVLELEAESVWEKDLLVALRAYGVTISRDHEEELRPLLPAHAREWFNEPRETWKELTPGHAKGTLVDDRRMLEILAGAEGEFERLRQEERFNIFRRRALDDFGLPDPAEQAEAPWRVAALARLLCTEAAAGNPAAPPPSGEQVIPAGLVRECALGLLADWQTNVHWIPSFERLCPKADAVAGLTYWAKGLTTLPHSYASRAVEETLLQQLAGQLDKIAQVDDLAQELAALEPALQERVKGFWGHLAAYPVGWRQLLGLSTAAGLLVEHNQAEKDWKSALDAVQWYTDRGWRLDLVGESLFEEAPDMPGQLHRIRVRLRRGYLRATDRIGCAFSELLDHDSRAVLALPTVGEVALAELEGGQVPTALLFLDALRFDLGQRLAELLNAGEPARRAEVQPARAPLPSVTPLGMAFALPLKRDQLRVELQPDKSFQVSAVSVSSNLAEAQARRDWLAARYAVKEFLSIADVVDGDQLKRGRAPRLVVVHGDVLDKAGHEGQLQLTGATEHLERYARAIRRLREAGFQRVIIATDHGFFHWQPEADEVEVVKPKGEVLWSSRRAMVGHDMTHPTALCLPVPQSDLEAMVPRSVNAFKTYGGLGFFHGGATLQELIVPVIVVQWPARATKVAVVLKPVEQITGQVPRVQVGPGIGGQTLFGPDETCLARRVRIKVQEPTSGRVIFRHEDPVTVEPGGEVCTVALTLVESHPALPYGSPLVVLVLDADDEEILAREEVTLKVDIDEW